MTVVNVGIDYCLVHHGTRNEDDPDSVCDWADDDDSDETRETGEPRPCNLVPLVYVQPAP